MTERDDSPPKALIEIKDLFGASAPTTALVKAIALGVGNFISPWQRRRDARADVEILATLGRALEDSGLTTESAELTLGDRATIRMTAENRRHQSNRESIALEAVNEFKQLPAPPSTEQKETPLDTEWVDRFWKLAECVTDADKQIWWGRILSRKMTGISQISARTLEFLSTLSSEEAQQLEKIATYALRSTRSNGKLQIGIVSGMKHDHARSCFVSEDDLRALNRKLAAKKAAIQSDHFGALGVFTESGFADSFAIPVIDNSMRFSISNCPVLLRGKEEPLVVDRANHLTIFHGRAITQLGRDVLDIIDSSPDVECIAIMQEIARAYGHELTMGD